MTLAVQDNTGSVSGANGYISVAEFKAYHDDRGNSYAAAADDEAIERAIIRATDYLDQRFTFQGQKRLGREQFTEWPRTNVWDRDRFYITDLPREVKEATAEYALRAIAADLNPDPDRDGSGAVVQSKAEAVGPISESVTFVSGAIFQMPRYPAADQKLIKAGLVNTSGTVLRA